MTVQNIRHVAEVFDKVISNCKHALSINTDMGKTIENAHTSIIDMLEKLSGQVKRPKVEERLLGKYRKEKIAYLAKYNNMS